jgi:hypothetical protein
LCLVTGENAEESEAVLRDQVLRETRKIWFQNVAVIEDSLWGCCFVFSPSPQVAKGVKDRRERLRMNRAQGVLHLQELRTMWLV